MHADYEDVLELPRGEEPTPWNLCQHALKVIKGRWSEAEPIIMKDPRYASWYALNIIKGRWPKAEPTIMEEPTLACWYACEVIKDRWPEAEPIIMRNAYRWLDYCGHFGIF